jgi:hypothetical protein
MKRTLQAVFLAVFAVEALVVGQGAEVTRVLGEIRAALGGAAKVAAVKSMSVDGRTTRVAQDGSSVDQNFEMAFELPAGSIKFVKKDAIATMGGVTISRRSGFNGNDLIDETEMPPGMSGGGNTRVVRMGPGGPMTSGQATPEQKQEMLTSSKREFARIVLGMIGDTTAAYPVAFTYGGQVDAAGGKADVLELKAIDGFSGKLYVDGKTHLPLMLSWMDKEPLRMSMGGGNTMIVGGGAGQTRTFSSGAAGSPDDVARMQAEIAARMKEAEANRRTVEFRLYYADYKAVDGVKLPTRIQRMMDGLPTEELNLDKITVNGKIDPARFAVVK